MIWTFLASRYLWPAVLVLWVIIAGLLIVFVHGAGKAVRAMERR